MAFTAFGLFIECLGWTFVAFTAVCSIYEAFGLVVLWHLCSIYGALGLDPCGVYSINSVYWALGLDVCGVLQRL